MHMNIKIIIQLLFWNMAATVAIAQHKYALLIAIDAYAPPPGYQSSGSSGRTIFPDLQGCKNDARSMASVIVSKFSFAPADVDTLFDQNAGRNNILKALEALKKKCSKGDIAFIFYAGHGSQVINSKSREYDKLDESIVPADTWKENVADIRDKELASICNGFLDKGIKLTVITDCCHSASLSRGPILPPRLRYMPAGNFDANDSTAPLPPEGRSEGNFLILSAAQDNEFAQEQTDEDGNPHGAFTIALLAAIHQQSVNATASSLFASARAILKSNGKKQEPVMGGTPDRQQQTLFGIEKGTVSDKSIVPVLKIRGTRVELQGGFALQLRRGNELLRIYPGSDSVLLRIDTITGINKCMASVVKGKISNVKPGHFFEVNNWVSSSGPLLKIYLPGRQLTKEQFNRIVKTSAELKASKKIVYLNDLANCSPAVTVYFDGDKCYINRNGIQKEVSSFSAGNILSQCRQNDSVFVEIPPSPEVAKAVGDKLAANSLIVETKDISDAHYVLYGEWQNNGVAYALRKIQVSLKDSLESLPITTKLFPVSVQSQASVNNLADSVFEYALRLAKIRGWLTLVGPDKSNSNFPFYLQLRHKDTQKPLAGSVYRINEAYSLYLVGDHINAGIAQKYIYVFTIDRNGKMSLAYPDADDGNIENRFPRYISGNTVADYRLLDFTVTEPAGTDNLFLLSTSEPIPNYAFLFDQNGVKDAARGVETTNPLEDILNFGNAAKARGFERATPANWSLTRLSVQSTY